MGSARAKWAIVGGMLGTLGTGGIYLTSILLVYVISYYRLHGETALTLEDGTWISPCLASTTALAGPFAAKLTDYIEPRR
jgi:hypothetical protein